MKFGKKKFISLIVSILLLVCASYLVFVFKNIYEDYNSLVLLKERVEKINQDTPISVIEDTLKDGKTQINKTSSDLNRLHFLFFVTAFEREYDSVIGVLEQATYLLNAGDLAIGIIKKADIGNKFSEIDFANPETIKKIDNSLLSFKTEINKFSESGRIIITKKNPESRFESVKKIQNLVNSYTSNIAKGFRLVSDSEDGIATFLGLRGEKKYLLLIENSQELRPGGGLITTYGILDIINGQIKNLTIDHVQNLRLIYLLPYEQNPEAIQKTMRHQKDMYLYDANWNGDPEVWLEKMFTSWNKQKEKVDGLIVLNTKVLEDIVRQYEPLRLAGIKEDFHADDIVASLDQYFELENKNVVTEKYKILGPVVESIFQNITASKPQKIFAILGDIKKRFQARDIFVYMPDPAVRMALEKNGVHGKLPEVVGDEFYPLIANLGSGKADGYIKRYLTLDIFAQDPTVPVSRATIKHDYSSGQDVFRAGGYYGFLRVLLPLGSKIGSFDGFNLASDGADTDSKRQVYGNYFTVGTGKTKDISIAYALADSVAESLKKGSYLLTLRKQGGVEMPYIINFYLPDTWTHPEVFVTGGTYEFDRKSKKIIWRGEWLKDETIEIKK